MKQLVIALLVLTALAGQSFAETNSRQVSIRAELDTMRDDAKRERTETTGYKLAINLRAAASLAGELRVVTVFFAKKLPGDGTIERKSTRTFTPGPNHESNITSGTERFTYTREHDVKVETKKKPGGNNKKKQPARYKTIPASGEKYSGWAVRVYKGSELVGEQASSSHLLLDE